MKKILMIGDLHGSHVWKQETKYPDEYERIIFIGDYTDEWVRTDSEILQNLLDVLDFKRKYLDKVILLWGNHDVAYYHGRAECSGFRPSMRTILHQTFTHNKDLFNLAYQFETLAGNYICTHAGVHEEWYKWYINPGSKIFNNADKETISFITPDLKVSTILNTLFNRNYSYIFTVGNDRGGWSRFGGPLWIDSSTLKNNSLKGYYQIVGHTPQDEVNTFNRITMVDVKGEVDPFYVLDVQDDYKEYF